MIGRCRRRRELSVCEEEDHWTFDLLTLHMRRTVPHLTTEGTVSQRGENGGWGGGRGGLPLNWSHFKVLSFNIVLNKLTKMIKADFRDEGFSIRGESPREHQTKDSKVSPEQRGIVFNLRNIDTFTE